MASLLSRPVWVALLTALALYAVLCFLAVVFQPKLVFFPGPPPTTTPRYVGLDYRELELVTADGVRLHGWYVPAGDPAGAVLVSHGNAGSIEHRLPLATEFHGMGLAVLLFDYRGYGRSEGSPTEQGLYLDAEAAYAFLTEEEAFPAERIVAYGESLGAAVAIELATRRPLAGLIAESGFTSLPDMGARLYPWLPVRWLSRFQFDSESKIGAVRAPVLVVHSPGDEIVPFSHAERLLAAASEPKSLLRTGGSHNDGGFVGRGAWVARMAEFVDGVLAER